MAQIKMNSRTAKAIANKNAKKGNTSKGTENVQPAVTEAIQTATEEKDPLADVKARANEIAAELFQNEQLSTWVEHYVSQMQKARQDLLIAEARKMGLRLVREDSAPAEKSKTYNLTPPAERKTRKPRASSGGANELANEILEIISKAGKSGIKATEIKSHLSSEPTAGTYNGAMKVLKEGNQIKQEGSKRGAVYYA